VSDLPQWVARHPVLWGIVAAVLAFVIGGPFNGLYAQAIVVAPLVGIFNWWIWRRGGPAHGWRARLLERFPPKGRP
jgi:hypothetical protein